MTADERRDISDRAGDALNQHQQGCQNCDVSQMLTDPNWVAGLCPIGSIFAEAWRRAERAYLEEVFALEFHG